MLLLPRLQPDTTTQEQSVLMAISIVGNNKTYLGLRVKCPILEFLDRCYKSPQYQISRKSVLCKPPWYKQTDRQPDGRTDSSLLQFQSQRALLLRFNFATNNKTFLDLPAKYAILTKFGFSRQIFIEFSNMKVHGNPFSGSRTEAGGQTDRHNEESGRFSRLCKLA